MENFLVPLSFTNRRAPLRAKVQADADRMYSHARYVIVLDEKGCVLEARPNRREDDGVVDCLAVFAPVTYQGTYFEKSVVLEIGFRRFVPYATTEYTPGHSTLRGPRVRRRKGDNPILLPPQPKKKVRKAKVIIKYRTPIVRFTPDGLFDVMPAVTKGIQECVDGFVKGWKSNPGKVTRWAKVDERWVPYDNVPTITIRIPYEAEVLCAAATFAELAWRQEPDSQFEVIARGLRARMQNYTLPKRRMGKDRDGNFTDEYVQEQTMLLYVADRLSAKVAGGYSRYMMERLLERVGSPESVEGKLIRQIYRVFRVPEPPEDNVQISYLSKYREMAETLLEQWGIRNYRNLRLERVKKDTALKRAEERRPYFSHARNSAIFSVFASEEVRAEMLQNYMARTFPEHEIDNVRPIESSPKAHAILAHEAEDDDIPWNPPVPAQKTGTDDDIPF